MHGYNFHEARRSKYTAVMFFLYFFFLFIYYFFVHVHHYILIFMYLYEVLNYYIMR